MIHKDHQDWLWDTALKACITLMPFVLAFCVWITAQINALQTEAAVAKMSRDQLFAAQVKVESDIVVIKQTQIKILLVLEQIKVSLQKD